MKNIFKFIPGFRSDVTWKKVVAIIYYLVAFTTLMVGFPVFLVELLFPFFIFYTIDFFKARKRYKIASEDEKNEHKIVMNKYLCSAVICFVIMGIAVNKAPKFDTQSSEANNKAITATKEKTEEKKDDKKDSKVIPVSTAAKADNKPVGELKVHFIDVGQADSILIQQGDENLLVDAGNNADDKTVKSYLDKVGVKEVHIMVATHPHEDHIGGMAYIMNNLKVGKIYIPKASTTTKTFENLITATKNKGLQFTAPAVGESFLIGKAKCTILAPNGAAYKNLNDYSIVLKVEFGQNSFLFTGDAEATSEMEMVNANANLRANVLKVAHHGSKTSTCVNFLNAVAPDCAVVSVGKGNTYSHPSQSTMNRLKAANIPVFRTDENGTIVATSNGKDITWNVQPASYNGVAEKVETNTTQTNNQAPVSKPAPKPAQQQTMVWLSATGKCYHRINNCGRMNPDKARQVTLEEAKQGYNPCSKCNPPR